MWSQSTQKGYKSSHYKCWVKHVVLKGKQCKTHVGKDEVFSQEIEKLKQLKKKNTKTNQYKQNKKPKRDNTFICRLNITNHLENTFLQLFSDKECVWVEQKR